MPTQRGTIAGTQRFWVLWPLYNYMIWTNLMWFDGTSESSFYSTLTLCQKLDAVNQLDPVSIRRLLLTEKELQGWKGLTWTPKLFYWVQAFALEHTVGSYVSCFSHNNLTPPTCLVEEALPTSLHLFCSIHAALTCHCLLEGKNSSRDRLLTFI